MFVKPFRYERAASLADACELLRRYGGDAKAIAGGQSLLPMMNLGLLELEAVIDLGHVDARAIAADGGYLRIGALTRHSDLERDALVRERQPLVAEAVRWIGSPRIRTRGTLGGSLAHSDPSAELPLVMTVLGAEYVVTDGSGSRSVKASDFHLSYFTSALGEDELIERVDVPTLGAGWGWGFVEVARRLGDFAVVSAAALARVAEGRVVEARVGLGGVGERPMRLAAVEMGVEGAAPDEVGSRVGPLEGLEPIDDAGATAAYRRRVAPVLVGRALAQAARRAEGSAA